MSSVAGTLSIGLSQRIALCATRSETDWMWPRRLQSVSRAIDVGFTPLQRRLERQVTPSQKGVNEPEALAIHNLVKAHQQSLHKKTDSVKYSAPRPTFA